MALVLCTGVDKTLLSTRKFILEHAGHTVIAVSDESALVAACRKHRFDVAVIGQTVSSNVKRRIFSLIRENSPDAKVLELYPFHDGRVLDHADAWLAVPADVPQDLADRVTVLAADKNQQA